MKNGKNILDALDKALKEMKRQDRTKAGRKAMAARKAKAKAARGVQS